MTTYIFGNRGWIGSLLLDYLHAKPLNAHIPTTAGFKEFEKKINGIAQFKPRDVLVNCSGQIPSTLEDMEFANCILPKYLSLLASNIGLQLIHLGSAAEYQRVSKEMHFKETDKLNNASRYGHTKGIGTQNVVSINKDALVLRLFNLFDKNLSPRNTLYEIIQKINFSIDNNKDQVQLEHEAYRDFTSIKDLSRAITFSVHNRLSGIYNFCSGIPISYYDIAREIITLRGADIEIKYKHPLKRDSIIGNNKKWIDRGGLSVNHSAADIAILINKIEVIA